MPDRGKRPDIAVARVYDDAPRDGRARLLVDRVWPRGVKKADLAPDDWLKEIAPSTELRRWFGHDPARWQEFRRRYIAELDANSGAVEHALDWCRKGPVVLLYSARDPAHNQALVLRDYLRDHLGKGKDGDG